MTSSRASRPDSGQEHHLAEHRERLLALRGVELHQIEERRGIVARLRRHQRLVRARAALVGQRRAVEQQDLAELLFDAQLAEERREGRIAHRHLEFRSEFVAEAVSQRRDRLASRVLVLVEEQRPRSPLGEQRAAGEPTRSAANHDRVVASRRHRVSSRRGSTAPNTARRTRW